MIKVVLSGRWDDAQPPVSLSLNFLILMYYFSLPYPTNKISGYFESSSWRLLLIVSFLQAK